MKISAGVVARRLSNKKVIVVLLLAVLLIAAITFLIVKWYQTGPEEGIKTYGNPRLAETVGKTPPTDQEGKIRFYETMGQAYVDTGNYKEACDAFEKEDSAITDRSADAQLSANLGFYQCYKGLGDKGKAKSYLEKEIERVKSRPEIEEYVKKLQDRIQEL